MRTAADSQISQPAPSRSPGFRVDYGARYHTVGGAPACADPGRYAELHRYRAEADTLMIEKMIREGHCRRLLDGLPVVAVEFVGRDWNGDLISVRVIGSRQTLVLEAPLALAELAADPDWPRRDARRR